MKRFVYFEEGHPRQHKGKTCWVDVEKTKQISPVFEFIFKSDTITPDDLRQFKESLVVALEHEGFVFYETILYRYIKSRDKIKEFGVQYKRIS